MLSILLMYIFKQNSRKNNYGRKINISFTVVQQAHVVEHVVIVLNLSPAFVNVALGTANQNSGRMRATLGLQ